jgi:hypothetical protein
MHGQHAQLPIAENVTTLSNLSASFSKIRQIRETSLTVHREPLSLKKLYLLNGRFKILKTVGEP